MTDQELNMMGLDAQQIYTYKFLVRMLPEQKLVIDKYAANPGLLPTKMFEVGIAIRDGLPESVLYELMVEGAAADTSKDELMVIRHEALYRQLSGSVSEPESQQAADGERDNGVIGQLQVIAQLQVSARDEVKTSLETEFKKNAAMLKQLQSKLDVFQKEVAQSILNLQQKVSCESEHIKSGLTCIESRIAVPPSDGVVQGQRETTSKACWWKKNLQRKKPSAADEKERLEVIHKICQLNFNEEQFQLLTAAAENRLITSEELQILGNPEISAEQMRSSIDLLIKMRGGTKVAVVPVQEVNHKSTESPESTEKNCTGSFQNDTI